MRTLPELLIFYKEVFLPAYAELVGYVGDKPAQVLIEIENMSTHLIRSLDESESETLRAENLNKAYNHLVRLAIDCYKMLWAVVRDDFLEAEEIAIAAMADGITKPQFFLYKQEFKEMSKRARELEMSLVGTTPEGCLSAWSAAIYFGWDVIGKYKKEMIKIPSPIVLTGEDAPESYRAPFARATSIDEAIGELGVH